MLSVTDEPIVVCCRRAHGSGGAKRVGERCKRTRSAECSPCFLQVKEMPEKCTAYLVMTSTIRLYSSDAERSALRRSGML